MSEPATPEPVKFERQAVLLIHGIGEQRPMQTLRGFVRAVWTNDRSVHHKHARAAVYSKPDTVSGSFELRRLTTTKNAKNVRTDFFEYYWAHLMEGTSARDVLAWGRLLLIRSPRTVPRQLFSAWLALLLLAAVIALFAVQLVLPSDMRFIPIPPWASGIASAVITIAAMPILKNIIGDAARYLNAAPNNVKRRQEIRAKGVELLEKLHASGYQRIIVVGHSLGTVIGYDILTYGWAKFSERFEPNKVHAVLDAMEADVAAGNVTPETFQQQQRALFDELQANGNPWRVTDFLTLGSPLAHASVLLAKDAEDLQHRQQTRELPTCPPVLEAGRFSFPVKNKQRILHHAAVFAPCRWTNLYFPARFLIAGDLIGGPLAPLFGPGIRDIKVTTKLRYGLLSHTLYWTAEPGESPAPHLAALRESLNLLDVAAAEDDSEDELATPPV